jgi:hypothetical protein
LAERSLTQHLFDVAGNLTTGGSSNAYTLQTAQAINGYSAGLWVRAKANHTNSGAATLNINGVGAADIRKGVTTALASGDIISGRFYDFVYDATNSVFQVLEVLGDGQVTTAAIADDAVTNAKLANMANGTIKARITSGSGDPEDATLTQVLDLTGGAAQGDVLYRGASAWDNLAAGTSGQFLQTQGAGANPTWANPAVVAIAQGTLTNATDLSIALPSGYDAIEFEIQNFRPATDNVELRMRFSQSGSYLAGASDYAWANYLGGNGFTQDNADSEITIASVWGNAAAEFGSMRVLVSSVSSNSIAKNASWVGYYTDTAGTPQANHGGGRLIANTDAIDGIRFLFSSGNISTGAYAVRGFRYQ